MTGEEIKKKLQEAKDSGWGGTAEVPLPVLEWSIKYIDSLEKSIAKLSPPEPKKE